MKNTLKVERAKLNFTQQDLADKVKVSRQTIGVLDYKDTLFLSTNNPIIKIDTTKINFIDTDTINILYTPYISKKENKIGFIFQKKFKKTYKLNVYPNALTDIFNTSNDLSLIHI